MIVFLLLVIIAILLFGSSAVIGFFGIVLGFIAALFALGAALEIWNALSLAGKIILICSPIILMVLGVILFSIMFFLGKKTSARVRVLRENEEADGRRANLIECNRLRRHHEEQAKERLLKQANRPHRASWYDW